MRESESKYWDEEATNRTDNVLRDNIWKREIIVKKLLESDLIQRNVLEIGIGTGTAAAAINLIFLGHWNYVGTDVSKVFCDRFTDRTRLISVHTDIRALPRVEGGFSRIICLDSLEHVRPEDRPEGYEQINQVMSEHGRILINMPLGETNHDLEFDHPFDETDIVELCKATNTKINIFERWQSQGPTKPSYAWVELVR